MSSRMRELLVGMGLLTSTVILVIGGMEVGLRATGLIQLHPKPPAIFQSSANPAISYRLRPSIREPAYRATVTTNSMGFRSPELDGRPIIAVLGDSITFGYGVEDHETLPSRLEAVMPAYQWLNTAAPGYHLGQETAMYAEAVQPLHPVAIMLVMHPNDMQPDTGWLDEDGILRSGDDARGTRIARTCRPVETGILGLIPGRCWLDLHSAIYVAVKKVATLRDIRQSLEKARRESEAAPDRDSITDADVAAYAEQLDQLTALLPPDMPRAFVIWPDRELHAVSRPKIRSLAEERGFTVIDLYDVFGNRAGTLGWDSVHPHPDTIARAAHSIAEHFERMRWPH